MERLQERFTEFILSILLQNGKTSHFVVVLNRNGPYRPYGLFQRNEPEEEVGPDLLVSETNINKPYCSDEGVSTFLTHRVQCQQENLVLSRRLRSEYRSIV